MHYIYSYLNDLNIQLQGIQKIMSEIFTAVKAFKLKLKLLRNQILKGEISHFYKCTQHIPQIKYIILGKNRQMNSML